ncbi:MAG: sensor histidine kinase, partial [Actinomycetaceae bacterium]
LEHDRIAGSPGAGPRAAGAAQNDDHLARRLVEAGAETTEEAAALAAAGDDAVERAVLATRVGAALRRIDVAAAQIGTLVSGLRSYARAGGSAEAPPVPVDVADSLRTALTLTSHRLRRVTTETNLGDVAAVLAPPGRLEQVWTNVLVNAADALDGPGMVEIDLSTGDDGQVRVVVANDGPVIPPEDLERIFEPRFTTRPGSSDSGLGLGLSLCREIVTAAGGTMVARSAPGRTQMIVELPPPRGTRQAADGPAGEEWT